MRLLTPLLKASVIAAVVFAIPWIRLPGVASSLRIAVGVFIGFGVPIVIMGIAIGFPIAFAMEKCRMLRCWSATAVGAIVGASLGVLFSYGAWGGPEPGGVENPFMFTFSPLHWRAPGFTDGIAYTNADLVASILLASAVGAALGLSFWFFHSRGTRYPVPGTR